MTEAGSRASLAPCRHTTRRAGPHRAVPGTSRPVGRQAGATQITPVEKGQAMTRHRITHPVGCNVSYEHMKRNSPFQVRSFIAGRQLL